MRDRALAACLLLSCSAFSERVWAGPALDASAPPPAMAPAPPPRIVDLQARRARPQVLPVACPTTDTAPGATERLSADAIIEELKRGAVRKAETEALLAEVTQARAALRADEERIEAARLDLELQRAELEQLPSKKPTVSTPPSFDAAKLAATMKAMNPDRASALMARLERPLAADVMRVLAKPAAAAILERLPPDTAAAIVAKMAAPPSTPPQPTAVASSPASSVTPQDGDQTAARTEGARR